MYVNSFYLHVRDQEGELLWDFHKTGVLDLNKNGQTLIEDFYKTGSGFKHKWPNIN